MTRLLVALLLAAEAGTPGDVLTLPQALENCDDHQPLLVQAQANTQAAGARVDEALGGYLPQVNGSAAFIYSQPFGSSSNGVSSVGVVGASGAGGSGAVIGGAPGAAPRISLGLTAYQLIYDFNQTLDKIRAARASVAQYAYTQDEARVTTHLTVRSAYYNARAEKALLQVARDTLDNEKKHLTLTEAQIRVGVQPEIALATEKATYSTDVYQEINAEGTYATGKSQLNQAMGVEGPIDYDVQAVDAPPVAGEDRTTDQLMEQALQARPAYLAAVKQVDAQVLLVASYRGNLFPSIYGEGGILSSGPHLDDQTGNIFGEIALAWPIFNWTNINATREQRADLLLYEGQRDQLRQQIRVDLETARLQVATYLSSVKAAQDAVVNAHEQLRLAEGRYQSGVGNIIELGDAQVAFTNSQVQEIQAQFNLNNARATLMAKLGQP